MRIILHSVKAGGRILTKLSACLLNRRLSSSLCIDSYHVPILSNGFAVVNSPFTVHIKPLDPTEYIEDDSFLTILEEGKEMPSKASARLSLNLHVRDDMRRIHKSGFEEEFMKNIGYERRVITKNLRQFLEISCHPQEKHPFPAVDISLTLEIPVQLNYRINALDFADVYANSLEGAWQSEITTDQGNCHIKSIKATDLHIGTKGGDIICPTYLMAEFGTLETEKAGNISVEKLQGRKFCLNSVTGDIHASSTYLTRGEIKSESGNIKLGDIHGHTEVKTREGTITIGSVSGNLSATTASGNVQLHLSQFKSVDLKSSEGDVTATMDENESMTTTLKATARDIELESSVQFVPKEEEVTEECMKMSGQVTVGGNQNMRDMSKIHVQAKSGIFKLGLKDWFSSLNLNKKY